MPVCYYKAGIDIQRYMSIVCIVHCMEHAYADFSIQEMVEEMLGMHMRCGEKRLECMKEWVWTKVKGMQHYASPHAGYAEQERDQETLNYI